MAPSDRKTIVITGGTSGIGKAAALGFAERGWRVAICGRRRERLNAVEAEAGLELAQECDVADPMQVAGFFDLCVDRLGRIDVVFNNAGAFAPPALVGDLEVEVWRRMIDTNLNGAF